MALNVENAKLKDLRIMEKSFGVKLGDLVRLANRKEVSMADLSADVLCAMVFLTKRCEDPNFPVEEVEELSFAELMDLAQAEGTVVEADETDPT